MGSKNAHKSLLLLDAAVSVGPASSMSLGQHPEDPQSNALAKLRYSP